MASKRFMGGAMRFWTLCFAAFLAAVQLGTNAHAEPAAGAASSDAEPSAEEVAANLANPNTPLASLTMKLQLRIYEGDLPGADKQEDAYLQAWLSKVGDKWDTPAGRDQGVRLDYRCQGYRGRSGAYGKRV